MKKVLYYLIIMLAFTLNACDNEMDNMQVFTTDYYSIFYR